MKMRYSLVAAALLWSWCALAGAEEKSAADILPASTVGYVEVTNPKQLLGLVLEHPLRRKVEELDQYKQALQSKEFQQFLLGKVFIEFQIGMDLRTAAEKLTGGGIYLAGDPKTNGAALLIKSTDQALLEKVRDTMIRLTRDDAKNKSQPDPIKSVEYRGLTAYSYGEAKFATAGPWLIVTNKDDLGKQMLDNYLDGGASLAADKQFQAARAAMVGQPAAWAYAGLAPVRDAGLAKDLYKDKSDNPVIELLLGGVLSTLKQTPYATAALYAETEQLKLVLSTPHDPTWVGKPREFFFGAAGKGAAPAPLVPKQTVLSLGTFRDLSSMWLSKSDLFDENVNAGFAQADSTLTTLFSGRDFGRDILGAFRPEMQLVVARQDYKGLTTPEPDIKLPAGALVFQLKDAEKMQPQLKILFQSLIGFVNITSAMQGQPPLDTNVDKVGEGRLIAATYLPDKSGEGKINYNFSPTIGFAGDSFIVSSTSRLASELIELASAAKSPPAAATAAFDNTRINFSAPVLKDILQDNRKQLVAQNQLREGHTKEQAEKETDSLLSLLGAVKDLSARLSGDGKYLNLEVELRLEPIK